MTGQVIRVNTNSFFVISQGDANENLEYKCTARGNLKKHGQILVGDFVEFTNGVIEKVLERKNRLYRPNVANVDMVVIVISPQPKPDFLLIDKLIVNAYSADIKVVFALNKVDITNETSLEVKREYSKTKIDVIDISAKDGRGLSYLKEKISESLVVLAGQSAVGKTSIVNSIFNLNAKIGDMSDKILRGKHTTTRSEIYSYENFKIIDSPGFAVIESFIEPSELASYYTEFENLSTKCRFRGCLHINEPDCKVKEAVRLGKISAERYERYKIIYNELLERRNFYEKN